VHRPVYCMQVADATSVRVQQIFVVFKRFSFLRFVSIDRFRRQHCLIMAVKVFNRVMNVLSNLVAFGVMYVARIAFSFLLVYVFNFALNIAEQWSCELPITIGLYC
jgi:hypothetical protein